MIYIKPISLFKLGVTCFSPQKGLPKKLKKKSYFLAEPSEPVLDFFLVGGLRAETSLSLKDSPVDDSVSAETADSSADFRPKVGDVNFFNLS